MKDNNEPIVLGELKKEKSSKPLFVLFGFALLIGTIFYLPDIQRYLYYGEGVIPNFYRSIAGEEEIDDMIINKPTTTTTTTTAAVDDGLTQLRLDKVFNTGDVYLSEIKIADNIISYKISAKSSINLDNNFYYLEIYDENKTLLGTVKLSGNAGSASSKKSQDLSFNANSSKYYLKFYKLEEDSLDNLSVNSLTCEKSNEKYVYNFGDNLLTSLVHEYTYSNDDLSVFNDNYAKAESKKSFINNLSNSSCTVTKINSNSYSFRAEIDLNSVSDFGEYKDVNYFTKNINSKMIKYDMSIKGFDCK